MNHKTLGFAAATAALALSVGLTASPALAAIGDGTWGVWTAADLNDATSGGITLGDSSVGSVTYTADITGANPGSQASIESVNEKGEWFTAETAPGAIFGANGPSDSENLIIMEGDDVTGVMVITFENPVPAGSLGVAIGDLDGNDIDEEGTDRVSVEATSASGADLTSAELNGAVFNMCDVTVNADMPSDCGDAQDTSVPTMSTPTATSVKFAADILASSGTGESGWVHPTTDVKTVTVTWTSADTGSSIRVYVSVKKPSLPDTGVDVASISLTSAVLGLLGAAALIAVRRRRA